MAAAARRTALCRSFCAYAGRDPRDAGVAGVGSRVYGPGLYGNGSGKKKAGTRGRQREALDIRGCFILLFSALFSLLLRVLPSFRASSSCRTSRNGARSFRFNVPLFIYLICRERRYRRASAFRPCRIFLSEGRAIGSRRTPRAYFSRRESWTRSFISRSPLSRKLRRGRSGEEDRPESKPRLGINQSTS